MLGADNNAAANAAETGTSLLYAGEQYDSALSQYYLRARYYDPSNGRFNRTDPYAGNTQDPQSLHKYLYCHANPINAIDSSGLFTYISMLAATSIRAILANLQSDFGSYAIYAAESALSGMSLNQALLMAVVFAVGGWLAGKLIGLVADFVSGILSRGIGKLAKGVARIGDDIVIPGTFLSRSGRLVPGTKGVVTGGSSATLRSRLFRAQGLKAPSKLPGWQTHHIIPSELMEHRVIQRIGMDFDDATNGMLLREEKMHFGPHSNYNRAMRRALDDLDVLPIDTQIERVYGIQCNATEKLLERNSLKATDIASEDTWYRLLSERFFE